MIDLHTLQSDITFAFCPSNHERLVVSYMSCWWVGTWYKKSSQVPASGEDHLCRQFCEPSINSNDVPADLGNNSDILLRSASVYASSSSEPELRSSCMVSTKVLQRVSQTQNACCQAVCYDACISLVLICSRVWDVCLVNAGSFALTLITKCCC